MAARECGGDADFIISPPHGFSLLWRLISPERRLMMCTLLYFPFNGVASPPTPPRTYRISCSLLGVILARCINFFSGWWILKRRLPADEFFEKREESAGRQPARHGRSTICIPLPLSCVLQHLKFERCTLYETSKNKAKTCFEQD